MKIILEQVIQKRGFQESIEFTTVITTGKETQIRSNAVYTTSRSIKQGYPLTEF